MCVCACACVTVCVEDVEMEEVLTVKREQDERVSTQYLFQSRSSK